MKTDKDTAASAEFPECRAHHWDYAERLCSACMCKGHVLGRSLELLLNREKKGSEPGGLKF